MSFGSDLHYCFTLQEQLDMSEAVGDTGLSPLFLTAALGCNRVPDNRSYLRNVDNTS